jgi:hypothetical protein
MGNDSALVDSPGRRAATNWFADGLPEIVVGLEFAILSGLCLWLFYLHLHTWMKMLPAATILLLIILVNGGDRKITQFLKARVAYPRTGYVQPPEHAAELEAREPIVSLAIVSRVHSPRENVTDFRRRTVSVLFAGWIIPGAINRPWGLPVGMAAVAAALYALNRSTERPYRWWYALLLPLAGLACMGLRFGKVDPDLVRQSCVFVIAGVWLFAQGAWTLFAYLRRNPRAITDEGGTRE